MVISWCASGGSTFSVQSQQDMLCLLHTAVLPIPPIILLLAYIIRVRQISPFRIFSGLDEITRRNYYVLSVCCLLMVLLNVSYAFTTTSEPSLSLIFNCTMQVIGWLLCSLIVRKECYRLTFWPGSLVKSYLTLSFFCLIALAILQASGKQNVALLVQLCALFLTLLVANAVAYLKDFVISADQAAKMELDRVCVLNYDYEDGGSRRRSNSGISLCGWNLFGGPRDDSDSYEPFLHDKLSISSAHSGDVFLASQSDNRSSTLNQQVLPQITHNSSVLSAMERQLSPQQYSSKSSFSSMFSRAFSFSNEPANPNLAGSAATGAGLGYTATTTSTTNPFHTSSSAYDPHLEARSAEAPSDEEQGKALQRVLRQQRAKSAASDPGLAPRGLLDASGSSALRGGLTGMSSAGTVNRGYNSRMAEQQHGEFWKITITRWAMRRSRLQSSDTDDALLGVSMREHGSSTSTSNKQIQSTVMAGAGIGVDTLSSSDRSAVDSGSRVLGGLEGEVEYEIVLQEVHAWLWSGVKTNAGGMEGGGVGVNAQQNSSTPSSGGPSSASTSNSTGAGTSGGLANKQQAKKWVVWRSAAETLALHSQLLSVFGDLAPRKPHLRTAVKTVKSVGSYSLLQSDITNDMKTIAVYATALLRSAQYLSLPQVRGFVQLEVDCLPPALQSIAANGVTSSMIAGQSVLSAAAAAMSGAAATRDWSDNTIASLPVEDEESGNIRQSFLQSGGFSGSSGLAGFGDEEVDRESMMSRPGAGAPVDSIQGKWRKVFLNMRVKLKPHEIAIRTRLFVGVISGAEISAWLMKHYCSELVAAALEGNDSASSHHDAFKHAQDRGEACAIGQELLNCGLLVPICRPPSDSSGLGGDVAGEGGRSQRDVDPDDNEFNELLSMQSASTLISAASRERDVPAASDNNNNNGNGNGAPLFSDYSCYLYRFPARSATAGGIGSYALFGAPVAVTIPEFAALDESEDAGGRGTNAGIRDTTVLTLGGAGKRPSTILGSIAGGSGTVEYLVNVRHADEEWQIWKRFSDFKEFNKQLGREGIRPEISFPSSSFGTLGGQSLFETRRSKLELFMNSALESVVQSGEPTALSLTALFLDDEFNELVII